MICLTAHDMADAIKPTICFQHFQNELKWIKRKEVKNIIIKKN
jgi:hypothetical protein